MRKTVILFRFRSHNSHPVILSLSKDQRPEGEHVILNVMTYRKLILRQAQDDWTGIVKPIDSLRFEIGGHRPRYKLAYPVLFEIDQIEVGLDLFLGGGADGTALLEGGQFLG